MSAISKASEGLASLLIGRKAAQGPDVGVKATTRFLDKLIKVKWDSTNKLHLKLGEESPKVSKNPILEGDLEPTIRKKLINYSQRCHQAKAALAETQARIPLAKYFTNLEVELVAMGLPQNLIDSLKTQLASLDTRAALDTDKFQNIKHDPNSSRLNFNFEFAYTREVNEPQGVKPCRSSEQSSALDAIAFVMSGKKLEEPYQELLNIMAVTTPIFDNALAAMTDQSTGELLDFYLTLKLLSGITQDASIVAPLRPEILLLLRRKAIIAFSKLCSWDEIIPLIGKSQEQALFALTEYGDKTLKEFLGARQKFLTFAQRNKNYCLVREGTLLGQARTSSKSTDVAETITNELGKSNELLAVETAVRNLIRPDTDATRATTWDNPVDAVTELIGKGQNIIALKSYFPESTSTAAIGTPFRFSNYAQLQLDLLDGIVGAGVKKLVFNPYDVFFRILPELIDASAGQGYFDRNHDQEKTFKENFDGLIRDFFQNRNSVSFARYLQGLGYAQDEMSYAFVEMANFISELKKITKNITVTVSSSDKYQNIQDATNHTLYYGCDNSCMGYVPAAQRLVIRHYPPNPFFYFSSDDIEPRKMDKVITEVQKDLVVGDSKTGPYFSATTQVNDAIRAVFTDASETQLPQVMLHNHLGHDFVISTTKLEDDEEATLEQVLEPDEVLVGS